MSSFSTATSNGMRTSNPSFSPLEALKASELELSPLKGEFINYDVDTTYVMAFTIRNRSTTTQTLRFFPPQKCVNAFRLVNYDSVRLAPGLSRVIDVEFSTHTVEDYEDSFVILTERGMKVDVHLLAQSAPALEMKSKIDFGVVEQNHGPLSLPFELHNKGRRDASVSFSVAEEDKGMVHFYPSVILAKALGTTKVNVEITKLSIGKFHWPVEVRIEGEESPRMLTVCLEVVDCRSRLLDVATGEEAVSVVFPRVYAGAKEKYELLMINGSEVGVSFAFQQTNDLATKEVPPFSFLPEQGSLGPKEKRKVFVQFEPPMNRIHKGWNNPASAKKTEMSPVGEIKKFEALFSLLFVETEETHSFHVVGECTETRVSIDRTVLDFGECAMSDYRTEKIVLTNEITELPVVFEFNRVTHFCVEPTSGKIAPGGSVTILVSFRPHSPGVFQEKIKLVLNKTVHRAVSVMGEAIVVPGFKRLLVGDIDKVPEDFIIPEKPPNVSCSEDQLAKYAEQGDEAPMRLTAAERGTAVDIGMVPAEGLHPPRPSQRLQLKELKEEDVNTDSSDGHIAPMAFDVKSLIRRRFNEAPENAVERRDCRRELLPMDLLKIVAPIKVLSFDRITVGTEAVKPYYIYNGTAASILVTMPPEEMYPELSFSPASQVIPPGRMATFDISLTSQRIQACQMVVSFLVNYLYSMRLTLHAEVVPVEVNLSFYELTLSFADFTDEPEIRSSLVLTNNGNCEASYWWKMPPKCAFRIEPEEGTIPPMQQTSAQITFSPQQGVFISTCDAFLAVEGASVDKRLQLTGVVEQTNCAWSKLLLKGSGEAQIDFRRIPVSKSSSTVLFIANHGHSNAYYSFDSLPDSMKVVPSCGRITAGETEDLIFSIKPDKVENISQVVNCHVRGMKRPLRMHVTATVVAPPLTVSKGAGTISGIGLTDKSPELVLNYGDIYQGFEKRLAVTVRNTGDVSAVVQVDLSQYYPDLKLRWSGGLDSEEIDGEDHDWSNQVEVVGEDADDVKATSEDLKLHSNKGKPQSARKNFLGVYLITVEAMSDEALYFCYRPSDRLSMYNSASNYAASPQGSAKNFRFQVPWKQLGADEVLHALPLLTLTARPLCPKVEITQHEITFSPMVLGHVPKPQTFQIKNLCLEAIQWAVQNPPDEPCENKEFLLEPMNGSIEPNGVASVSVSFINKQVGSFKGLFQVYVNEAPHKPCATLVTKAVSIQPRIFCEKQQIIFPPVPLGVAIKEVLFFKNDGYESIHLQYNGESKQVLSVVFPRGDVMLSDTRRLPVEIVFCSAHCITMSSTIQIMSNMGDVVEIGVCATAMNSLLTTAPFLRYRDNHATIGPILPSELSQGKTLNKRKQSISSLKKESYVNVTQQSLQEVQPFMYREQKANTVVQIASLDRKGSYAYRYPEIAALDMTESLFRSYFTRNVVDMISRFFNIMLLRAPVDNIVDAMQQSHGTLLYDTIYRLCGKRPGSVNMEAAMLGEGGEKDPATNPPGTFVNPVPKPTTRSKPPSVAGSSMTSQKPILSPSAPSVTQGMVGPSYLKPNVVIGSASVNRKVKGEVALNTLCDFLQYYGCCLHHIRVHYLLTYEEYLQVCRSKKPMSAEAYREISTQCWLSVLLEMIRVFFMSKLSLQSIIQGMKSTNDVYLPVEKWEMHSIYIKNALGGSNVYSTTESLMLFWARSCVERFASEKGSPFAAAQKIRVSNFSDLHDARVFIAVVLVYCPALHPFFFACEKPVVLNPTTPLDHDHNATLLLNALTELAIPQMPTARVYLEFAPVNLALFTAALLSYLPKFISSEVVNFEGKLLTPIQRVIQITNTGQKARLYRVIIDNPLFHPNQKELIVPAQSTLPLEIDFLPRYNRVVRARCILVDHTPLPIEEHLPLVFALCAAPNMEPTKVFEISTNLYEPLMYDLLVENPFQQDCIVSVRVQQEGLGSEGPESSTLLKTNSSSPVVRELPDQPSKAIEESPEHLVSSSSSKGRTQQPSSPSARKDSPYAKSPRGGEAPPEAPSSPPSESVMRPCKNFAFFVHTDVLPLRRGDAAKIPVLFIPLIRGLYVMKLTFRDEREGEFSYVVKGMCTDPKVTETIDFQTEMGETCDVTVTVRNLNPTAERTVRLFEERCRQAHREIPPINLDWNSNVYEVEFLGAGLEGPNPYFVPVPEEHESGSPLKKGMLRVNPFPPLAIEGQGSTLQFQFTPTTAGRYPAFLRLLSPIDVRMIKLNGECVPRGERQILRFNCPARQVISQEITITNKSEQDWHISATLEGDAFSCGRELRVGKGKQKEFKIRYSPQWITDGKEDKGLLTLKNSGTGQKHLYTLSGTATAPLSEEVLHLQCKARERQSLVMTVPNVARHDCTYFVETDLPFTEGEGFIVIPRDSFGRYVLNCLPSVGGTYTGKVIFKSNQGRYVWYAVTVVVTPPEKEGVVTIQTDVRTSVAVNVTIKNPLPTPMMFNVRRYGSGLYGENTVSIDGSGTATYSCIFVPTHAGETDGRLSLFNDEVGEFWYEVKMIVTESKPEELKFVAPLGEVVNACVKLSNTLAQECAIQVMNTNVKNYSIHPTMLMIPPMQDLLVNITYRPTSVGISQDGMLTLSHHQLGQWTYAMQGMGLLPSPNRVSRCVCEIGSSTSITLSFTNTLDVESKMLITYDDDASHFSLARATDGVLLPGMTGNVTVVFKPNAVGTHHTTVKIKPEVGTRCPEYDVCWEFPIDAIAEWRDTTTPFRFRCAARKNYEEVITLPAPGLTAEDMKQAKIHFEPDAKQNYISAVNASFSCELMDDNPMPDAFKGFIRFTPLRSMVASGDLLVTGSNGGCWRYRVYLEASPAPIDDVIRMKSAYKTSSSITFDLYNVFSYKSKFAAYLTSDSSRDFSVAPAHGVLLPFIQGQKGAAAATPIRITFTPSTRVPRVEGMLVVDTEDMQWSFKVVGCLDSEKVRR